MECLLFFVVFVIAYIGFRKFLNERKDPERISLCLSLFLTILGFFLAIGDDFLSQFNYNPWKTVISIFSPKGNTRYSEIDADHKSSKPYYYFALDVSASMKKGNEKLTNGIREKIAILNKNGKCPSKGWTFDTIKNEIPFHKLVQVRLMNSINNLDEKYGGKFNDYSVVCFADKPSEIKDLSESKSLKDVLKEIEEQPFRGMKTNFIDLLEYYCKKTDYFSHKDPYEPIDCYIIFFSDYLHDVNGDDNKADIEKRIENVLREMRKKNINLRLYRLDSPNNNKEFSVDTIFKRFFPESLVGILDGDDELIYPIIAKRPISFFYANSLFEENLKAHFKFEGIEKKRQISIGLRANSDIDDLDKMKQVYYLIDGTDTIPLSSSLHKITVDKYDEIELMIKGYIPAPYKSPDIIIMDEKKGVQNIVPVTFYKKLPISGYLLLAIIIPLGFILVFCWYNDTIKKRFRSWYDDKKYKLCSWCNAIKCKNIFPGEDLAKQKPDDSDNHQPTDLTIHKVEDSANHVSETTETS